MINKFNQWLHRDCAPQIQSWRDKYQKVDIERVILEGEREHLAKQLNEAKQIIKHLEGNLHQDTQLNSKQKESAKKGIAILKSKVLDVVKKAEKKDIGIPEVYAEMLEQERKARKKDSCGPQRRVKNNSR